MTENVTSAVEEIKEDAPLNDPKAPENKEAVIEDIVKLLNRLFEPNNLCHNAYLTQRAVGVSFHIPIKFIYEEHKIKAKSTDREIINQALERAENVIVNKKDDIIESVRPKKDQLRKNITIKGITKEDEPELKELVNTLEGAKEGVSIWTSNVALKIVTIFCKDEDSAVHVFQQLSKTQFKNAPIDCTLDFENLYITALDTLKGKGVPQAKGYQQNMQFMMPQFQMQALFFNQMNGGYMNNFYPSQNNFYMQNQMNPMNTFGNPNANGYNGSRKPGYKPFGGPKRGGGGYKKTRGERGGRYHRGGDRSSRQPTGVEVNEGDFPPLSNENQINQ